MRLTILHLSDLHVSETSELPKPDSVAAVLREAAELPDYVLVMVTGDIAFSGKKTQYERASEFLQGVIQTGVAITSAKCDLVVIPGNHDCTFPEDASVRDLVLEKVRSSGGECGTDAYMRTCMEVQDEFFRWTAAEGLSTPGTDRTHLAWVTEKIALDGKTISLICCNTAWMSSLHEQQGHLRFPIASVPTASSTDLVLTLLHHPYNWFEASNARDLMQTVEESTDIILTGHEHEGSAFNKLTEDGPNVKYVEGQALCDTNGVASAFNVVNVDLQASKYQIITYTWDGARYAAPKKAPLWLTFVKNARRASASTDLTSEMEQFLSDPGAQLSHRAKEIRLPDIFVAPNLQRYVRVHGEEGLHREIIYSDYTVNRVFEDRRVHFSGVAQCGKTTLAKVLYSHAIQRQLTRMAHT